MNARWLPLVAIGLVAGLHVRLSAQSSPRPFQATDYYTLTGVGEPRPAPDGRRIAFVVTTVVEDNDRRHSEIWMAPADGSAPAFRYTSPATEASNPVWSPDGSLLAFTSKREGFDDDVWFLRTWAPGGEAFQVRGVHALPSFSGDGKWLLYSWRGAEPDSTKKDSWRSRVSPSAITRGPDPKRFDGRVYTSLPFVEDERGLVPPRETRRPSHLYLVPSGGGEPKQLTSGADLDPSGPAWSPDSKTVYFTAETRGNIHVFAAPATGGPVRQITTGERQLTGPAITRDGKWLTYAASDATHPAELFVAPVGRAAAGPDRRLTSFNDSLLAQLVTIPADTFWFTSVGGLSVETFVMRPHGYRPGKSYPF